MKQYEFDEIDEKLESADLANIFNIYEDPKIGSNYFTYNINRTINITGADNMSPEYYEEYIAFEGETWTSIADKHYGTHRLWWIVCKMNGIIDPSNLPDHGTKLKILKEDYVRSLLENIKLN